jgi:hypothetical protein
MNLRKRVTENMTYSTPVFEGHVRGSFVKSLPKSLRDGFFSTCTIQLNKL